MKLATLRNGSRDGVLCVVSKDLQRFLLADSVSPTMQFALDHWEQVCSKLSSLYDRCNHGEGQPVNWNAFMSPLPRAYEWIDASAYINHVILVRKARNAAPPETLRTDPLIYQGGSGVFLGPYDDIPLRDESWGCDFESEVCVVLGDTPQATSPQDAPNYIRLIMLANDVSLRNLIPEELAKGFGFFTSKPATAFSPLAVTPDELGDSWENTRVHLPLVTQLNGVRFGEPNAGPEMHFSFSDLIAHITKTRSYTAGTILGSGTVSNEDRSKGSSCIAERRMLEVINSGKAQTSFLRFGDRVEIEMFDQKGKSIFGRIDQTVRKTF